MSAWLRSRERRPPRVALVAAMKTEAAYLADWVHHHLYFGFDPIEIHVNRSDDGTEELARAIARVEPRLSVFNVDHFDRQFGPQANVQTLALREARHRLKRDLGRADYLCFLDADEFWTPADFRSSIQDVLADADHPRIAAFNWFNRIGDHPAFGPPFPDRVRLRPHRMVKTCFRARTYARNLTPHGIIPLRAHAMWTATGVEMGTDNIFKATSTPTEFGPAFVLHRYYRSPVEYLAILGRQRPVTAGQVFKNNRDGYDGKPRPKRELDFVPEPAARVAYRESNARFLDQTGAAPRLNHARDHVEARARRALETYLAMPPAEQDIWATQFHGLDLDHLAAELGVE